MPLKQQKQRIPANLLLVQTITTHNTHGHHGWRQWGGTGVSAFGQDSSAWWLLHSPQSSASKLCVPFSNFSTFWWSKRWSSVSSSNAAKHLASSSVCHSNDMLCFILVMWVCHPCLHWLCALTQLSSPSQWFTHATKAWCLFFVKLQGSIHTHPGVSTRKAISLQKSVQLSSLKHEPVSSDWHMHFSASSWKSSRDMRITDHMTNRLTSDTMSLHQHVKKSILMNVKIIQVKLD